MSKLDPRINPYRPEIASSNLVGRVQADKFVEGEVMRDHVAKLFIVDRTKFGITYC